MASLLFEADRHEPLGDTAWDAARAREAVVAIARDIEQGRLAEGHWPAHPLDVDGGVPRPEKSLYVGSAGVLWALWTLQREGAVQLAGDPAESIARVHAAYLAEPDTGSVVPSYLLGEAGVLLAWWRMTGSSVAADRLFASIESNIGNPTNESLWAAPGTMIAAWHLWLASGEERWRTLFLANVEQVWRTWHFDAKAGCHLWTQDMYGKVVQYLGAGRDCSGEEGVDGRPCLGGEGEVRLAETRTAVLRAEPELRMALDPEPDDRPEIHHAASAEWREHFVVERGADTDIGTLDRHMIDHGYIMDRGSSDRGRIA